jgi:hypothetical protein
MSAQDSTWNTRPRVPLELLDDANVRGTPLPTLRELLDYWLLLRPTDPVPRTVHGLTEVLAE